MKRALKTIRDWGWIVCLAVLALLAVFFVRDRQLSFINNEIEAIRAGARARNKVAREGAEAALAEVEREHEKTLKELNDGQREKAKHLRSNPSALSRYLVRIGRES